MGRPRSAFSPSESNELWTRWRAGETLKSIGRAFDRPSSSIHYQLARTGGISPLSRRRSRLALTQREREEISRGIAVGLSIRSIASALDRAASTISREIKRNGGPELYRASVADQMAWQRAVRPKRCKLVQLPTLQKIVTKKLQLNWSPEQISGWLKMKNPNKPMKQISHEAIYRSLFIQARGALKKELMEHLRSRRTIRRSRYYGAKADGRGKIKELVSIRERPASVEDRAVPGHWEGDLLSGTNNSYIATLVERKSRYLTLVKLKGKDTETVVTALIKQASKIPGELYKSLTWDRGKELAAHQCFTLATNIDVYFCDPQSPWQRGTNENTNRLIRQYFPKGIDLSSYSQSELNKVARELNERPRKTLNYETPADNFKASVASIH